MGQFLCLGIRTALSVKRKGLGPWGHLTYEKVKKDVESQLVPPSLYDIEEREDEVVYFLKADVAKEEFVPFIKEFYKDRYDEIGHKCDQNVALEEIEKLHNLSEWIDLARGKRFESYQLSGHGAYVNVYNGNDWIRASEQAIILSLTGKVWMECYRPLFEFLLSTLKVRYSQYKLKNALSIFITE